MKKYITLMVLLGLVEIGLALYLTSWREHFWTSIQLKQQGEFLHQLGIFTIVALTLCFVSAYAGYCGNLAAIKWREILNIKAISVESDIENLNQRIQEDCREYPQLFLDIVFGICKAIAYIIIFSMALVMEFSYIYLLIILTYAILSTLVAKKIAKPLIGLNYDSQRAEASYRNELTTINFNNCVGIMLGIAIRTKRLNYFQTLYGQCGVLVPYIVLASDYFLSVITFGQLMKATSIMSTILDNASYGITAFGSINRLISCRKRLKEIGVV